MTRLTESGTDESIKTMMTLADLGFVSDENTIDRPTWTHQARSDVRFRAIETLDEFREVEDIQRDVMGVTEYDLCPASQLVLVPDTGGFVLGAYVTSMEQERLAGFSIGWGAFFDGRPRLCSDMLAVRPEYRALKIGSTLKRLQSAQALQHGFEEIVWTVDPLRSINAHLNFRILGAHANRYERNRYGDYGAGLYGAMPSDRLHVTWPVSEHAVQQRILDPGMASKTPVVTGDNLLQIALPREIDQMVRTDPDSALQHRLRLRSELEAAFSDSYQVVDFEPSDQGAVHAGWLILTSNPKGNMEQ